MGRRHRGALGVCVVVVVGQSEVGIGRAASAHLGKSLGHGAQYAPHYLARFGGSTRCQDVYPRSFVHVVGGNTHAVGCSHGHHARIRGGYHVDVVLRIVTRCEDNKTTFHVRTGLFVALRVASGIVGKVVDAVFQQVELRFEDALEVLVVEVFASVEGVTPRAVAYGCPVFGSKFEGLNDVSSRCSLFGSIAPVYFAAHQSHARVVAAVATGHATNAQAVVVSCGNGSCHVRSMSAGHDNVGVALTAFGCIEITSVYLLARILVDTLPGRGGQVFVFEVDTRVHHGHHHVGVARFFLPSREQVYVCPRLKHAIFVYGCGVMPLVL